MADESSLVRSIRILQIFARGREVTVKQLHRYFSGDVGIRTLQRDLNRLSEANIPLQIKKVNGNESIWFLENKYFDFIPISLEFSEYLAVMLLKKSAKIFKNTPVESDINSLVEKIDELLPKEIITYLDNDDNSLTDIFEVKMTGQVDYSIYGKYLEPIMESIIKRTEIRIRYQSPSRQAPIAHDVMPYQLLFALGSLYLVCYNSKYDNYMLMALSRMKKCVTTEISFDRDKNYTIDAILANRFGLFPGTQEKVILKFNKIVAPHIVDRMWHPTQDIKKYRDGSLKLEMETSISPELTSWILGWKEHVKVLAPDMLLSNIKIHLVKMNAQYE